MRPVETLRPQRSSRTNRGTLMARVKEIATGAGISAVAFPASFFGGWLLLALAPVLLVLATPFVIVYGIYMALRSTVEAGRILCLKGLRRHEEMESRYRDAIDRLLSLAPPRAQPVACTCIRKDGDGYLGVVRIRTADGSSYFQVRDESIERVAEGCIASVDSSKGRFPIVDRIKPVETPVCNRASCHMGKGSIFYIDEPQFKPANDGAEPANDGADAAA